MSGTGQALRAIQAVQKLTFKVSRPCKLFKWFKTTHRKTLAAFLTQLNGKKASGGADSGSKDNNQLVVKGGR